MAIEMDDDVAFSSGKNEYIRPTIFDRYESVASTACQFIGVLGIIMSITLSNIFFFDMYNCTNHQISSSRDIATFLGYDWYYIVDKNSVMGICEYWSIIIIQLVNLYNNGSLVVATFVKNRCCTINWMAFTGFLLVLKTISMYIHLKNADQITAIYIFGSILYMVSLLVSLLIILFAQVAWLNLENNEAPPSVNQTIMKQMEMSVFDSPTPYEPNFNYTSF